MTKLHKLFPYLQSMMIGLTQRGALHCIHVASTRNYPIPLALLFLASGTDPNPPSLYNMGNM